MWKIAGGILIAVSILIIAQRLVAAAQVAAFNEQMAVQRKDSQARQVARRNALAIEQERRQAAEDEAMRIPDGHECRGGIVMKRLENGWQQVSDLNDPRCQ